MRTPFFAALLSASIAWAPSAVQPRSKSLYPSGTAGTPSHWRGTIEPTEEVRCYDFREVRR